MTKIKAEDWCKQDATSIRGSWMIAPYQNIFIGSYPLDGATKEWADQFDAIVNVSCTQGALFHPSRPDQRTYWYPVNEGGEWPYGYFILMFKAIDFHYRKGHKVYIHCHAGAYRSPSIFRLWLVACENKTLEEAMNIENGNKRWEDDPHMKHYATYQNYILGNLPPGFQVFMERLKCGNIQEKSFVDVLWNPTKVARIPEVKTKRYKETWDVIRVYKYKLLRPFKRALELYRNWKMGYIEIRTSHYSRTTTDDWFRASKKRPKRL